MATDIPTAILTKGQREYLLGEREPAQERTMRTRMRDRLNAALLLDIPLLKRTAGDGWNPEDLIQDAGMDLRLDTFYSLVELVYHLIEAQGGKPEKIIQDGIEIAKRSRADALLEQFHDDPTTMTFQELSFLEETGRIDVRELMAAFQNPPQDPAPGLTSPADMEKLRGVLGDPQDPDRDPTPPDDSEELKDVLEEVFEDG